MVIKGMKTIGEKKIVLYSALFVAIVVILISISISSSKNKFDSSFIGANPEQVVEKYFEAWGDGDYGAMYSVISDGFKEIDSNAKDLDSFRDYASSQDIGSVMIIKIDETSNNGKTATVDYSVEFEIVDDGLMPFEGVFTLKHREDDIVTGWKLIHPYGKNIDTS